MGNREEGRIDMRFLSRVKAHGGFGNVARAFAHRNFRVYVAGNSVSLIGWWLQKVAVGWLAWTLTHSGAWLGFVSLADFLPILLLSPFAGVMADRRDRVRILRLTQLCGCAQAGLLAVLVYTGAIGIYLLFGLVLALGIASSLAQPARLALIPTLVDRDSLASALAINSVVFNMARFIGPAIAGFLIAMSALSPPSPPMRLGMSRSRSRCIGCATCRRCRRHRRRTRCVPRSKPFSTLPVTPASARCCCCLR